MTSAEIWAGHRTVVAKPPNLRPTRGRRNRSIPIGGLVCRFVFAPKLARNFVLLSNAATGEVWLDSAQFKHDGCVIGRLLRAAGPFINFARYQSFSQLG